MWIEAASDVSGHAKLDRGLKLVARDLRSHCMTYGTPLACVRLAQADEHGWGVPTNVDEARKLYSVCTHQNREHLERERRARAVEALFYEDDADGRVREFTAACAGHWAGSKAEQR